MPNVPQLIRTVTRQKRVQQYIIEKDYVLSYLLAAAASEWQQQLLPFVPEAPSAAELLPQVQSLILSIW